MAGIIAQNGRSLVGEVWRFLVVGTSNAAVDFVVYLILTRSFLFWREHYLMANAVAFILANLNSFIWNRHWTFKAKEGGIWRQYAGFFSTSLVYLAFIQAGLWLLVSVWGMYDLLAKVIVIGLGMILYFTVLKRFIFSRSLQEEG